MAVSQLAYVGIGVSDMARWKSFAAEVLGLEIGEPSDDGAVYLRMDEYHHRIALYPSGEDDVLYIGLQAPTHAAYEAGKTALRAAGVSVTPGTPDEIADRRVLDLVKFDTGDLPFELCVGLHARWDPPFRPARPMSGFKTGALGFGHVVLRSATPEESVKLLTGALGFRISDYIGPMVFLHCNPRHHSIAFQPRSANLPRSRDKKMWHFMLETKALDDVGTALDMATKTGAPLASTLGRHSNDHMVSFYVVTPSGFEVEYGWDGRLVDDAVWEIRRHDRGSLWGHKPLPTAVGQAPAAAPAPATAQAPAVATRATAVAATATAAASTAVQAPATAPQTGATAAETRPAAAHAPAPAAHPPATPHSPAVATQDPVAAVPHL
jgi:2,3-dihydroxybiphenyl 1,2-dioxygenase